MLIGLKLVFALSMRAGSIKSMLLLPPVGSIVINKSPRTPSDCIVIMCVIYARYSFDFYFVSQSKSFRRLVSISISCIIILLVNNLILAVTAWSDAEWRYSRLII
jgi:hypothetical protein